MAGEEGFEPSHAGIKIQCLNQLGDSPKDVSVAGNCKSNSFYPVRRFVYQSQTHTICISIFELLLTDELAIYWGV